jgi:hypothetical protein
MVARWLPNPTLGKIWRVLQWMMLVYLVAIWSILRPISIFYGHLEYNPRFGMLHQEKSGTTAAQSSSSTDR